MVYGTRYLHERMIDCDNSYFVEVGFASEVNLGNQHLSVDDVVVLAVDAD